ncbi:MAG TPA: type IV pilus secretin PilQ [Burkholderiales bacterium]|nr:type IV pilus secretin PilQ [Burkholderiales bacterium]
MKALYQVCLCMLMAVLTIAAPAAHAQAGQNSIETVNVATQGGRVLIALTMKQPLSTVPASFSVATPPRLAFDFPNTVNGLGRNSQEVNEGDLRGYNVVQVGDRTRMVFNLKNVMTHEVNVDGNTLNIVLNPVIVPNAKGTVARFAEGAPNGQEHSLKDIDFRRGNASEGRVVIELSDTQTGIDVRTQGNNLVVDFLKTSLPENLRKRLDVADFATPVKSVAAFQQGENVRLVIEPTGLWEHNAYQTDTQFVVELKPVQYDPNKLIQGSRSGYRGEKLSLNFQNVDVRSVLNVIADFTDLNIITSDTVQGNLTLRLKDVPWDQALDIILQTRGLDMRKNGNVLWIAPRDELTTKEKLELESKIQIAELEPLRTEVFHLNYMKAEALLKILKDDKQRILSKRGSAVLDPRTNIVFVQDIPSRLEEIRRVILTTDIPVRQVMIEARIVEATDKFSRTLGARLGYSTTAAGAHNFLGGLLRPGGNLIPGVPPTVGAQPQINLPAAATDTLAQPGQFSFILFNSDQSRFLSLELSALESDGKGKIISSPRVVTANQVEALIEQGTEIPYLEASSSGSVSVAFRKAVLALKVRPHITPDGNVMMDVDVNKDAVSPTIQGALNQPAIDTKHVKTTVLVENGGTVVIGGIYTQEERNTVNKVPVLGDLPAVGRLFRNTFRLDNKTELLIFLTPKIVEERVSVR